MMNYCSYYSLGGGDQGVAERDGGDDVLVDYMWRDLQQQIGMLSCNHERSRGKEVALTLFTTVSLRP